MPAAVVEGEVAFLIAVLVDFDLVNLKENVFQLYTHRNLHSYLVLETVVNCLKMKMKRM